jgi:hypothetical protein
MARTYKWTVEIEIDAVEVEKHLVFGEDLAMNDATAYDMVADGLLHESPGNSFSVRSVRVVGPESPKNLVYALSFDGKSHLRVVQS